MTGVIGKVDALARVGLAIYPAHGVTTKKPRKRYDDIPRQLVAPILQGRQRSLALSDGFRLGRSWVNSGGHASDCSFGVFVAAVARPQKPNRLKAVASEMLDIPYVVNRLRPFR